MLTSYLVRDIMDKLISITLIFLSAISAEERPTISLEDGIIRGTHRTSFDGRLFSAFEGIPYALPPIGDLRFNEPQPTAGWTGTLEANVTHTCLQLEWGKTNVIGQEDCLYLNVYIPRNKIDSKEKLDVIVHFHGGGFMMLSPQVLARPDKLMDRDVVYVSPNYRLGAMGFLSSGDAVIPGNYGMKDQTLALKWVQRNIGKFGGNPNSVTITGVSAGGGSTHLHYFSPLSKGLFHRGIAGSGVALDPWAIKKDPWAAGKELAKKVGCYDESTEVVLRCLRERPALQLQQAILNVYKNHETLLPLTLFGPTVELELPTSFVTKNPHLQIRENLVSDVPFMAIMTSAEGSMPTFFYLQKLQQLNENLDSYLPHMLEYETKDETEQKKITEKVKQHYLNNEPITMENFEKFVKLCTDRLFHEGGGESVKQQATISKSDIYFLLMANDDETPGLGHIGVSHGEDMKYYYNSVFISDTPFSADEKILKERLLDMFVNFAKTGKAVIKDFDFEPVPKDGNLRYLVVKSPKELEMTSDSNFGDVKFWHSVGLE